MKIRKLMYDALVKKYESEIAEHLRKEGIPISNDELKFVIEGLVANGFVTYRKDGQKYLFGHQDQFFANDVKPWSPNV